MASKIKELVSKIPYPIGKILTNVPFHLRLGKAYTDYKQLVESSQNWSLDEKTAYVIDNMNRIKNHAQTSFDFYKNLYVENDVFDLKIKDLSDWSKIPLVSKENLRKRTTDFSGKYLINTGGTSGEPFSFYIDKQAWAREWAHMHYIWSLKGYSYKLPKITLRGKDLGDDIYRFNPIHNEFVINTYKSYSNVHNSKKIVDLILNKKIKYVHGYPSAIFTFFSELEKVISIDDHEKIKATLKVALLGSEFPLKYMMEYLEDKWNLDYISWYGHSEMSTLAFDLHKDNSYQPLVTYGYAELVSDELVATSYHNVDMPLIRYKTGDLISGVTDNGILSSFTIKEGRSGDFIEDKNGKNISLTSMIFGRHHKAFDVFDFVQVKQEIPGAAIIFVTNKSNYKVEELHTYFNFDNINIEFSFIELKEPVLSKAGKFKLKL